MDNSILIWKYLRPLLEENSDLNKYGINENTIFQLYANPDTPYPYIILRRDSLLPEYTKYNPGYSGWTNEVNISVSVYSDFYDEGADIANIIRDLLENYSLENEDIKIYPIELQATNETFTGTGYEQRLSFTARAD